VKVLVTSDSGGGKTTFCKELVKVLPCSYFNADDVRCQSKNWDFSAEGRILAAQNMLKTVNQSWMSIKLIDMILPTPELRKIIAPDVIVYLKPFGSSKYPDTSKIYLPPTKNECEKLFVVEVDEREKAVGDLISFFSKSL